jgi:hypothetical protein
MMRLRSFVEKHREILGWVLAALIFAAMAFDFFEGKNFSPRLLELRGIYAIIMLLFVGYIYILSTPVKPTLRKAEINSPD